MKLSIQDILDALEAQLSARLDGTVYRNLVPQNFDRPSFLIEVAEVRVVDASRCCVDLELEVAVTGFVEVDEYHNSHVGELQERMNAVLGLLSDGGIHVHDRFLDVLALKGGVGFDYFAVHATLAYTEERDLHDGSPLMGSVQLKFEKEE